MKSFAIVLLLSSPAAADITPRHQRPGRITCAMVRDFVALMGQEQAERMARSTGASDAKIAAARRCLRG
jgi:hypothetical protein